MTTSVLLVAIVAGPLVAALTVRVWDALWQEPATGPLGARFSRLLAAAQAAVVAALVVADSGAPFLAAAALYATMAAGVAVLVATGTTGDCGCWGAASSGRLGWRLAAGDLTLALAALAVAAVDPEPASTMAARAASVAVTAMTGLFVLVTVPSYRRLRPVVAEWAGPYRSWARGYPELDPARPRGARP